MIETYYLDESSSSGDLVSTGSILDFGQQPIFVLACIGVDDPDALGSELVRQKKLHRVQGPELKSTNLRTKPGFTADLAAYLELRRLPPLVEVVEKRFQICAMMVDNLIMPAVGPIDLTPGALWVKKQMAEFMRERMPDSLMMAYIDACTALTLQATDRCYQALLSWAQPLSLHDEVAFGIWHSAEDTYSDFRELDRTELASWRSGLPIPDDSKHGKPFWMLPNLSSFTNIYARLNHLHQRRGSNLTLVHDEQLQFDEIILKSKVAAEGLNNLDAVPSLRFADYGFSERAQMEFNSSSTNARIQAADVIAGFTMRYVQDMLFSARPVAQAHLDTFQALLGLSYPGQALGFNFMTSTPHVLKLRVKVY